MAADIQEPQKDEPVNTLWRTVAALVRALRGLHEWKVTISDSGNASPSGKVQFADANTGLELKLPLLPDRPASGDYVLTAQDGVLIWEEITDC